MTRGMRRFAYSLRLAVLLLCVLMISVAGCAGPHSTAGAPPGEVTDSAGKGAPIASKRNDRGKSRPSRREPAEVGPIISPVLTPLGTVVSVHREAQFVVVSFLDAAFPPLGARMSVFREDERTAEIRVTGPQRNLHVVADILTGDCRPGDKVRVPGTAAR